MKSNKQSKAFSFFLGLKIEIEWFIWLKLRYFYGASTQDNSMWKLGGWVRNGRKIPHWPSRNGCSLHCCRATWHPPPLSYRPGNYLLYFFRWEITYFISHQNFRGPSFFSNITWNIYTCVKLRLHFLKELFPSSLPRSTMFIQPSLALGKSNLKLKFETFFVT